MTSPLTALRGATVIVVEDGSRIDDAVVLIRDGRIEAVDSAAQLPIPDDAEVLDGTGRFVVPGYMDGNVHLMPFPSWGYPEFLARYEDRYDELILEGAQLALRAGFTTVFDSMGPLDALSDVRGRIARGADVGARLYVAGNILGFRAVFATEAARQATSAFRRRIDARFEAGGGPDLVFLRPDALFERVSEYIAQGVDFIKYGATGDGDPLTSEVGQSAVLRFSERQQRAIVEAAHAAGIPVQTHTGTAEAIHIAVEVGNDSGQHAFITGPTPMYDETIELMLARGYVAGTQWEPVAPIGLDVPVPPELVGTWESTWHVGAHNIARLIEAGVPHFVSTDAGTTDPDVAGEFGGTEGIADGLIPDVGEAGFLCAERMADHGMSAAEVLRSLTIHPARAYRVDGELGSIRPGKAADLLLLDADPLADARNLRTVSTVISGGTVVDRDALPARPVLTAAEAREPGGIRRR